MKKQYFVSDDKTLLDLSVIHQFLSQSYWAKDIPLTRLRTAIKNSLCFGVYQRDTHQQVGFARVITDQATFAYLADVFILASYRGLDLSKQLMNVIIEHPNLQA